jgi:hypothetical protein
MAVVAIGQFQKSGSLSKHLLLSAADRAATVRHLRYSVKSNF